MKWLLPDLQVGVVDNRPPRPRPGGTFIVVVPVVVAAVAFVESVTAAAAVAVAVVVVAVVVIALVEPAIVLGGGLPTSPFLVAAVGAFRALDGGL
jgi:hypothetical protein